MHSEDSCSPLCEANSEDSIPYLPKMAYFLNILAAIYLGELKSAGRLKLAEDCHSLHATGVRFTFPPLKNQIRESASSKGDTEN